MLFTSGAGRSRAGIVSHLVPICEHLHHYCIYIQFEIALQNDVHVQKVKHKYEQISSKVQKVKEYAPVAWQNSTNNSIPLYIL